MSTWRDALLRQWQRPGLTPASVGLRPLAWLYAAIVSLRRLGYACRPGAVKRLPVPVIVVGNLVAGGAGKTPAVIAIARLLQARGWTPGVISRGHGRRRSDLVVLDRHSTAADVGDEPLLIQRRAGVAVAVAADRVAAGRALLAAHPEVDLLIADDGLQHLRLARDIEVILFDDRGTGNSLVLPAGPLREPLPARLSTKAIVLYSAGRASTAWPGHLGTRRLSGLTPLQAWRQGEPADADALHRWRGRRALAAAGIARPQAFFAMLQAAGIDVQPCPLPDHFDFSTRPWPADTPAVIVTEKDAVKLEAGADDSATSPVWVATLDFALPPSFAAELDRRLGPPPRQPNPP